MFGFIRTKMVEPLPVDAKRGLKRALNAILSPAALTSAQSDSFIPVMGCQRSGTTLLFLMLTAHPKIIGLDENRSYGLLPSSFLLHQHRKQGYSTCFKLPTETSELNHISRSFREAKIIWMIRSPYSTVSSMRKLKGKNGSWLNTYAKTEILKLSVLYPEIKSIDLDSLDEVSLGAYVWKYKNLAIEKYAELKLNLLVIRYEDLLETSEATIAKILDFCELERSSSVLNFYQHHSPSQKHPGKTRPDKPLDASRAKPALSLSERETAAIKSICGDLLFRYGY